MYFILYSNYKSLGCVRGNQNSPKNSTAPPGFEISGSATGNDQTDNFKFLLCANMQVDTVIYVHVSLP